MISSIRFFLVSEAVCKEYEQLKNQYNVETNAMHKAMQQASQVMMHLYVTMRLLLSKWKAVNM